MDYLQPASSSRANRVKSWRSAGPRTALPSSPDRSQEHPSHIRLPASSGALRRHPIVFALFAEVTREIKNGLIAAGLQSLTRDIASQHQFPAVAPVGG